jgi:type III secretory pathway component EscS
MKYHEALWVVIGTAAPVIGLANVVTVGRGMSTASKISFIRKQSGLYPTSNFCAQATIYLALASVVVCILSLFGALASLATTSDQLPASVGVALVGSCLALLLPQLGCEFFIYSMFEDNLDAEHDYYMREAEKKEVQKRG